MVILFNQMAYLNIHKSLVNSQWAWAQIQHDMNRNVPENTILSNIENNCYGFNYVDFALLKKKQEEQDRYISTPIEVEEGVVQCLKCKSKKVYSVSVQTRASDEPMSTRAYCTECKSTWTQNC